MNPYKCPICGGKGIVPQGFYFNHEQVKQAMLTTEKCMTCEGTGVIWFDGVHLYAYPKGKPKSE